MLVRADRPGRRLRLPIGGRVAGRLRADDRVAERIGRQGLQPMRQDGCEHLQPCHEQQAQADETSRARRQQGLPG